MCRCSGLRGDNDDAFVSVVSLKEGLEFLRASSLASKSQGYSFGLCLVFISLIETIRKTSRAPRLTFDHNHSTDGDTQLAKLPIWSVPTSRDKRPRQTSALAGRAEAHGPCSKVCSGPFAYTSTSLVKAHLGIVQDYWHVDELAGVKYA